MTLVSAIVPQGIILWAGENWSKVQQFMHADVKSVEFSPCENFMVTLSSTDQVVNATVWDIRSIANNTNSTVVQRQFQPGRLGYVVSVPVLVLHSVFYPC
jgi:uncharacterized protein with WD repeat